jgi:hypothetical protein
MSPAVVAALIGAGGAVLATLIASLGSGRDAEQIRIQVEILSSLDPDSEAAKDMTRARDAAIARHATRVVYRSRVWADRVYLFIAIATSIAMGANGVLQVSEDRYWAAAASALFGLLFVWFGARYLERVLR